VVADKNTGNGRLFVCSGRATTALAAGDAVSATYPSFSGTSVVSVNAISGLVAGDTVDQTSVNSGNNPNPDSGSISGAQLGADVLAGFWVHRHRCDQRGSGSGTGTVSPQY
jgi:hypothetical protein